MIYDVIVIGGGPGGSESAYRLSKVGLNVLILERGGKGREKTCAGGVPPIDIDDFGPYPQNIIQRKVGNIQIIMDNKEQLKISGPKGTIFKRTDLDNYLQNRAIDSGSKIHYNSRVNNILETTDGVEVSTSNGETFKSSYCIGADGTYSITAKKVFHRRKWKKNEFANALHYHISVPELELNDIIGDNLYFFFGEPIGKGYGYIFPQKSSIIFGVCDLGGLSFKQIENQLDQLLNTTIIGQKVRDHKITSKKGGIIPYRPIWPLSSKRTLLVGDAAGLANPVHCGGIWQARKSGLFASEVIIDHINKQVPMSMYDNMIKNNIIERDNKYDYLIQKVIPHNRILKSLFVLSNYDDELYGAISNLIDMKNPHRDVYKTVRKKALKILMKSLFIRKSD